MRFLCLVCNKWFSVNRKEKLAVGTLVRLHLDGLPIRKLADQYELSVGTVFSKIRQYLRKLPHNADVSRKYSTRYSGIMVVDGKFVAVKGFEKKIPVVYGIDYLTHDIPTYKLLPSENYLGCLEYFQSLRLLNYPLKAVVCDDNQNIRDACLAVYPAAVVQICQNHYLENVRKTLNVRTDPTYAPFVRELETLFHPKRSEDDFNRVAKNILVKYKDQSLPVAVLVDIYRRKALLLGYLKCKNCPKTTNIIEAFNSHLNARLESLKGFKTHRTADDWLNGYFLRRRTKKYTDCKGKFKYLNGKKSLEETLKVGLDLPSFF